MLVRAPGVLSLPLRCSSRCELPPAQAETASREAGEAEAAAGRPLASVLDLNGHFCVAVPRCSERAGGPGRGPGVLLLNTTAGSYLSGSGGLVAATLFDLCFPATEGTEGCPAAGSSSVEGAPAARAGVAVAVSAAAGAGAGADGQQHAEQEEALVQMGFGAEAARHALRGTGGDLGRALEALLAAGS